MDIFHQITNILDQGVQRGWGSFHKVSPFFNPQKTGGGTNCLQPLTALIYSLYSEMAMD